MKITEKALQEVADEAARVVFHGMHPDGVGRIDEPLHCRGFREKMARIIVREVVDAAAKEL